MKELKYYKEKYLNKEYVPKELIPIILQSIKEDLENSNNDLDF